MKHTYKTQGTCSKRIDVRVEEGKVVDVLFEGGCNGNLQGLSSLVKGLSAEEICSRLEGIKCGKRDTSCPDQLCKALHEMGY